MVEAQSPIMKELEQLAERLNTSRRARRLMGAFTRRIRIEFQNGESATIVYSDGQMSLTEEGTGEEHLVLRVSDGGRLPDVLRGTLDITHILASGELQATRGKVTDLILWNRIIVAG